MDENKEDRAWLDWLRRHWLLVLVNVAAAAIMIYVWNMGEADIGFEGSDLPHPRLESGVWALRFLLISLAMSPMNRYLRWPQALRIRKTAGLWAFGFATLHFLNYIEEVPLQKWLNAELPAYLFLGLLGLLILLALAATSTDEAKRVLSKRWKRLHRWVYLAGAALVLHAILATDASKLMGIRDPDALPELQLYLLIYGLLMLPRLSTFLRKRRERAAEGEKIG